MSADDSTESKWKIKYQALLKQLDEQDLSTANYQSVLYRCITKLSILVQGTEPELDEQLIKLKNLLNQSSPEGEILQLLETLNEQFRQAEMVTEQKLVQFKETLREIFTVISYMALPKDLQSEQRTIFRKIKKIKGASEQHELLKIIGVFFQALLFSLQNKEVVLFPAKSSIPSLKKLILGEDIDEHENLNLPDAMQEYLAKLIDYLGVSTNQAELAEALYAEIEKGLCFKDLAIFIEKLSGLVLDVAKEDEERMDSFCTTLKGQMSDSKIYFTNLSGVITKQNTGADKLYKDVEDRVQAFNNIIIVDTDNTNKVEASNQLDSILELVSEYQSSSHDSLKDALKNIAHLNSKLAKAEQQISSLHKYVADKRYGMQKDALTGLPNRQAYLDWLENEMERAQRHSHSTCFAICDIDHFKSINDNYGHDVGDRALSGCAKLLKGKLRATDYIARYGGEEFVIILVETSLTDAKLVIENLRETIAQAPFKVQEEIINITVSIGLTEFRLGDNQDTLFKRADQALYLAKEQGRNQVVVSSPN